MSIFLQLLVNGLLLGGAYAIISISLTLIFGVVRVVNFAHGELLMVGLYATWLIASHTGQPVEKIEADSRRDRWFTAQEALEYGFVDHIRGSATDVVGGAGTDQS